MNDAFDSKERHSEAFLNLPLNASPDSLRALDRALFRMQGVREVEVDVLSGKIRVAFDPAILSLEKVREAMMRATSGGEGV